MQNPLSNLNKDKTDYLRYLLILISIILVTVMIPKRSKFKYEFEQGKPWMHEDLSAPFSFAIQKSPDEINNEKEEIRNSFRPIYTKDPDVSRSQSLRFKTQLTDAMSANSVPAYRRAYYLERGLKMLEDIYSRGIISLDTAHRDKPREFIITEVKNNVGEDRQLMTYYTLADAKNSIYERTTGDTTLNKVWFITNLLGSLEPDVTYNKDLSEKKIDELISNISLTRGMVRQNEKIITRGSIVTPERLLVLDSLKAQYEANPGKSYLLYIGYFLIIAMLFVLYAISLELFHEEIFLRVRSVVLILINVLIFTAITAYAADKGSFNVYIIPYCIVPIVLLAFFGIRLAMLTHMLVVLTCAVMVPNPFEFILLEVLAGFTAVLSMARIRYISQFFISALLILGTYAVVYLGLNFVKSSLITEIQWSNFIWFGGNFILTLLAYPLIYANEKIFGFLSDISLLELSDINNKLLKELFLRAPGTFQHSLQVANLAEAVIDRIGGNALLTRVGSLYHDVGKLVNPEYFIENQKFSNNPHDQLTDLQSAEIIIDHVPKGIEIAQQHHLPKKVIDFIRTHHGTTRVEYFYKHYLQDHEQADVDESIFRYPGPKPSSKETAVVMIVDSVEAASRSMKEPDEKQIDNLVDKIIDTKIQDNQFDYATITIQEINTARRILKKLVKSIYHIRIQYPAEVEAPKSF